MTDFESTTNASDPALMYYRPCVGVVLFNDQGQVWVGKRINEPGIGFQYTWQMPQGGIDRGEDPSAAAVRELQEETGATNAEIIREAANWYSYDLPKNMRNPSRKGLFRGQTQKWFALRFKGNDSEFQLDTYKKPEFSNWKWVNLVEVPELIVPFKRDVYVNVVEEFKDLPERIANEC